MKLYVLVLIYILSFSFVSSQENESRLLRFPATNGSEIIFSAGGDLYTVAIKGGIARKLTSDVGYEMFPRFSPDGKQVAYTAQFDGNTEVYLMSKDGGEPKRLTHTALLDRDDISDRMGPNNIVMNWMPDGKSITYRSRKQSFNDFKGQLFQVSVNGGLSKELPFSVGGFCSWSPDGKKMAMNRVFREFRTWKYYQGGMADDIWIVDIATGETTNITDNKYQDIMPMWTENEIYYLSDRERTMNIYCYNTASKQTKRISDFKEYDVKFASLGGGYIVFENAGFLYTYSISTHKTEKVNIVLNDDAIWSRNEWKDASKTIRGGDASPNGERVVLSARGDLFSLPATKGITRNLTQTSGIHERDATWSPDGKTIAYVSDATGEFEIYTMKQDGSGKPEQITNDGEPYKFSIKWSPDGKKIMWHDRLLRLRYVDIVTKEITNIYESKLGLVDHYNWSPDSKWVVFEHNAGNNFATIAVYNLEKKKYTDISDPMFESYHPAFSNDGKYIVFASDRNFNPTYSEVEWNISYNYLSGIYLVTLKKETPSPFSPENDEIVQITDKTNDTTKNSIIVKIDFEGIQQRTIPIPLKPGYYFELACINDIVYYHNRTSAGYSAGRYDLKKKENTDLGNILFGISANNKKMLVKDASLFGIIDLPSSKISIKDPLDLSNMKVKPDLKQEWMQIYSEAWRQMRDFFYVENMHGVNWDAIRKKYEVLVPHVRHRDDLTYVIGEMIGELNCGHAYISGGDKPRVERIALGLLGAKISKHESGYFQIDEIFDGASWSNELSSPLRSIGVNVSKGDFIIAIDGQTVKHSLDLFALMENKASKTIELTVNTTPSEKDTRKVLINTIKDESNLYYYQWVKGNIEKVNTATNGDVGYIHVPDMGSDGLNEFVKYFYPQLTKKALIIDDRGNGGGNVSPMIVERLMREVTRSRIARNYNIQQTVPGQMHMGAKILLIDQYSASDGDLFAYAFKKHNIGTVIGTRTWGGVIGITGTLPFIDGTDLRKPEFASYSAEKSEWMIEGVGVDPDIVVNNDPWKEFKGIDEQLLKAIELAKEKVKEYKGLPNIPKAPVK